MIQLVRLNRPDGSAEITLTIEQPVPNGIAEKTILYACGPEPMLAAVSRLAGKIGVPCQLSMERMMACGIGLCQSCAIKTHDPHAEDGWSYRLCCKDGPVLDGKDVIFD